MSNQELFDQDEANLETFLNSNNGKSLHDSLNKLLSVFRHAKTISSVQLATRTLQILRGFIGGRRYHEIEDMISMVRGLGRRIVQARPYEFVIKNSIRRVLFLIREEISLVNGKKVDFRPLVIDAISELLSEVENLMEPISKQSLDHIHNGDNILTYGYSSTLLQFLSFAHKHQRNFNVYVMENSPTPDSGHSMAAKLGEVGISAILIADCAAHAMMPKIDKIFLSPKCVLATGGVLASCGSNLIALSAQFHRKPFICVTGLHKLTPEVSGGNVLANAYDVAVNIDLSDIPIGRNVKLIQNSFDFIEPEQISLLITNTGAHQTSYVYRLLAEYYNLDEVL